MRSAVGTRYRLPSGSTVVVDREDGAYVYCRYIERGRVTGDRRGVALAPRWLERYGVRV